MPLSARAEAVSTLIRLGWSPPPPNAEQSLRILDDIARVRRTNATLALSPREHELLAHLANGESLATAAEKMKVGRETAKSQAKTIRRKLGVSTLLHAVALMVDEGVIEVRSRSASR